MSGATSALGLTDEQARTAALYFARGRSLLGVGLAGGCGRWRFW